MSEANERSQNAIRAMLHTDRMHRSVLDHARSRVGIHSRSQHWALRYLEEEGGSISSQKALAEHLEISAAAVAVMMRKLEACGYVERSASDSDSRSLEIRLTDSGREVLGETLRFFKSIDEQMMVGISDEELAVFIKCHTMMQENLRHMEGAENFNGGEEK